MTHRILIIGAGIAGLAAARRLKENGINSIILEARNRVGGRIHTDTTLGFPFDTGAMWIHGNQGNPISELADQLKIKYLLQNSANFLFCDSKNNKINSKSLKQYYSKFTSILENTKKNAFLLSKDISLSSAFNTFTAGNILFKEKEFMDFFMLKAEIYSGMNPDKLSTRYWDANEILTGGDYLFLEGYTALIDQLSKDCNVLFNNKVVSIYYKNNKVEVITEHNKFESDAVIITVPLGILKKNDIVFEPKLPLIKQTAIKQLGMAALIKIALKFSNNFWGNFETFYLTDQFGINIFINLYNYYQQPILIAVTGEGKFENRNAVNNEFLVARSMETLYKYFGTKIPYPEEYMVTQWGSDPLSLGSHSFTQVGSSKNDYRQLSEPIKNTLFFAGEATSDTYPATTHGAYLSGIREADRVSHFLG
jgi:monoamine oxidase